MINLLKAKSEFRKQGVTLIADKAKDGNGGSWKFVSEDRFLKIIQEPLSKCGLEIIATMNYLPELSVDTIRVILFHIESGENIESTISVPAVDPRKDRNGNPMYLDAEIERGKQFGYWSRILSIRILGLSDIDPEDVNNRPENISKETLTDYEIEELTRLIKSAVDLDMDRFFEFAKAAKVEDIYSAAFPKLKAMLLQKQPKDK